MGFITNLSKGGGGVDQGKRVWGRIFNARDKETVDNETPAQNRPKGNLGSVASVKQLLTALRSPAPGGWSDDRWAQTSAYQSIAYVSIFRMCEQMAQAEFQVLEKDERHPDGYRPVMADHPLVRLLEKPNEEDTFGDLMFCTTQQLQLTGMSLTWMVPNRDGLPVELYPVPTAIAVPAATLSAEYPNGYYRIQPIYPYGPFSSFPTPLTASGAIIPAEWMLRIKYPHPLLRWDGFSPMTGLRLHLDEVNAIDQSRWYAQRRAVNPSAVLNFDAVDGMQPLPEAEVERIHTDFENNQYGPQNTGRLFVATPGAKLEPWGATPKEMDYQQSWDQLVGFCMAGLGITKEAAGMLADSSYASLFATLKQFHMLTLEPLCTRIAAKLTRQIARLYGDQYVIRIRCQRIDDHDIKNAALGTLIQAKAITKNEVRRIQGEILGLEMTKAEWGQEIAGFEQPPQQPGMPGPDGMPAAPGAGGGMPPPPPLDGAAEDPEIAGSRPAPDGLGAGALGPRGKSLFADAVMKYSRQKNNRITQHLNGDGGRNGTH